MSWGYFPHTPTSHTSVLFIYFCSSLGTAFRILQPEFVSLITPPLSPQVTPEIFPEFLSLYRHQRCGHLGQRSHLRQICCYGTGVPRKGGQHRPHPHDELGESFNEISRLYDIFRPLGWDVKPRPPFMMSCDIMMTSYRPESPREEETGKVLVPTLTSPLNAPYRASWVSRARVL